MARIYLASSWRNPDQPMMVQGLRQSGHEVYDFRNPPGRPGFSWSDLDPKWRDWTPAQYRAALEHPIADAGFGADFAAMQWADTFVLLMPCGRSAHLELGWAVGAGKRTAVLLSFPSEPELMYKLAGLVTPSVGQLLSWLSQTEVQ